MKKVFYLIFLILPLVCFAQNWSWNVGNGGNAARNGQVENVLATLTETNVLWDGSTVFSYWPHQPFTEGNVVVTDRTFNMNDVLHGTWIVAYDIETGDTIWTADLPVDYPSTDWRNRVCGTNNGVVYATRSGNTNASFLHALDVTDGSVIWTSTELTDMSSGENVSFAENGDLIIGNFQSVMRLNAEDGSLMWQTTRYSPTSSGSEVSVFGDHVYGWETGGYGPKISVFDIDSGDFLFDSGGIGGGLVQQLGCLIGPDGIVYAPRTQNNVVTDSLVAFTDTGSSLERMWQIALPYIPFATFGIDREGDIYSYNTDYQVIHIDSHSGDILNESVRISDDIPNYRNSFAGGSICTPAGENIVRIHYFDTINREPTILDTSIIIGDPNNGIVAPHAAVDAEGYLYISNYQDAVYCFESNLDVVWQDTFDRPDGPAIGMDGHLVICADSYEMKVYEGRGGIAPGFIYGNVTLVGGTGNVQEVIVTAGEYVVSPDATGMYTFEIPSGIYNVSASLESYYPDVVEDVLVETGQATGPINLTLEAEVETNENLIASQIYLTNYPNPFNPTTEIRFHISDFDELQQIEIYNLKGQIIKVLECSNFFAANMRTSCSNFSVIWNGTDQNNQHVASGVYLCKLKSGNIEVSRKMLLLK